MKWYKYLGIYLSFFSIILLLSIILPGNNMDCIWTYGFSYNIAKGLIPYRDFNMVIGPLYPLLNSLTIIIFGNNLIWYDIFNCLIISFLFMFIFSKIKTRSYILLLSLSFIYPIIGYNTFCSLLVIIILMLLESNYKYKHSIIGIIIGIILMTKHNLALPLFVVYFFSNKNKIKSIFYVLIPVIPIILYLVLNNALYGYIDFCYLGIGSFVNNLYIVPFVLLCDSLLIIFLIKKYIESKDIKLLYLLAFQIITFPLVDVFHFACGLVPCLYYYLQVASKKNLYYIFNIFIIVITIISVSSSLLTFNFITKGFLKYTYANKINIDFVNKLNDYIIKNEKNGRVYTFLSSSYFRKIYFDKKIDFYDLINEGNLGTHNEKRIKEIDTCCRKNKCIFLLDYEYFKIHKVSQLDESYKNYVIDNYKYKEEIVNKIKVYEN